MMKNSHALGKKWSFWYLHRDPAVKTIQNNYENNVKLLATVSTVEQFWTVYCHLKRAGDLPVISDYHIFPEHIKPMWEDENNVNGGKLMIRLKKGVSSRIWENLILSVTGGKDIEDDENESEICGLVISVRFHEDIISVWNRNSSQEKVDALREKVAAVLPKNISIDYKSHNRK